VCSHRVNAVSCVALPSPLGLPCPRTGCRYTNKLLDLWLMKWRPLVGVKGLQQIVHAKVTGGPMPPLPMTATAPGTCPSCSRLRQQQLLPVIVAVAVAVLVVALSFCCYFLGRVGCSVRCSVTCGCGLWAVAVALWLWLWLWLWAVAVAVGDGCG
jgi:hypothetical protein